MTDQEATSPFTRGFVAAAVVIGAVLICGTLLIFTGPADAGDGKNSPSANSAAGNATLGSGDPAPDRGDSDPGTTTPGDSSSTVFPPAAAASTPATSPAASPQTSTTCDLPTDDQTIPTKPPATDGWEVSRRVVVPRSTTYGPTTTDTDGFRRCFAHSPTGAVYAAYNAIAALADQHQAVRTTKKLMLPGKDTTALISKLESEDPSDNPPAQLAGYRILDATQDRVTVVLALPVEEQYMSVNLTLVWHDGDWRVVPPKPGDQFGAPFSQHRDLDDFVAWKGL